jgi:hypothetical protein
MKIKDLNIVFCLLIFVIYVSSCRNKEEKPVPVSINKKGFFVVNEGNYTWGNSSLSFYDEINDKFYPDIFYDANAVPLGDVAFSMTVRNNKCYIVVNNSGLIYIVNADDLKYIGKITGLNSPRQIVIVNDTLAYVSDLYDTRIAKVNLLNNTISGYINIGHSTEKMLFSSGKIFITCWSYGNLVYSIDALTGVKLDSAVVGKQPNSIVNDINGNLWVLCDGGFTGSTYGEENATLWCLNNSNLDEIKHFTFPQIQSSPTHLNINGAGDSLYFINNDIFQMSINDNNMPINPIIISSGKNFYSMAVHTHSNEIIVADAKNYVANGEVMVYSKSGQLKKSFATGVNPGWVEIYDMTY